MMEGSQSFVIRHLSATLVLPTPARARKETDLPPEAEENLNSSSESIELIVQWTVYLKLWYCDLENFLAVTNRLTLSHKVPAYERAGELKCASKIYHSAVIIRRHDLLLPKLKSDSLRESCVPAESKMRSLRTGSASSSIPWRLLGFLK